MRGFPRTANALEDEGPGVSLAGLVLVTLLLVGWLAWLFAARISVFEVTPLGRLEVDRAAYPITPQVDGKVVAAPMRMGRQVEAGDLLVQLETEDLEIRLREDDARLSSIEKELEAARLELELRQSSLRENRRSSELALEEAKARLREAEIRADFAAAEAERARVLYEDGQLSQVEAERQAAEAERLRESTASSRITVDRERAELKSRELIDQTEIAELSREVAGLEGNAETTRVALDKIRHEIEKRAIRAPRPGEIGDIVDLPLMSMVGEGDLLGTILASGEIKVIADFAAASALGRVRLGQEARVRLDGFPWTQYGMLRATVDRVAREPRGGRLRVEFEVDAKRSGRVPLEHGLTGTVEVEVERISPAVLLLRTLGKALEGQPVAPAPNPEDAATS